MAESAAQLQSIADDEQDVQAYKAALDGWDKIANYTEPKLKSVEVTGKDGEDLIPNNITVKYE
jgi:hypothetical protein